MLVAMKKPHEATEIICPACDGTGAEKIKQPTEPDRKIYPATCKQCHGKGRIEKPQ